MGQITDVPVIAIDGLSGTGKSAVRAAVARRLGFKEHDSGALYRAVALLANEQGRMNEHDCGLIASQLGIRIDGESVYLDGVDRTSDIRSNECGTIAARVAQWQRVHEELRRFQIGLRQAPGLVADGRDMCHIYDTPHRFLLRTDIKVRAKRRAEQLVRLGKPGDLDTIEKSIKARDLADETRKVNPFRPHLEAMMIDTTSSTVAEVANIIINVYRTPQPRKESGRKTALVQ